MKVLVIQGAGMNMRGKAEVEIFGPLTLDQMNDQICDYAREFGMKVEFFHVAQEPLGSVGRNQRADRKR